jgi:hypothetical protein
MNKLTPRSKIMGIIILILIFTILPYRWGSQQSTELKDSIEFSKSETQAIEDKLASVEAQSQPATLDSQVNILRIFVPNEASLPTLIPILANAGANAGMLLTSGSPEKAKKNVVSVESGLKDLPADTDTYLMTVSFYGPASNLSRLLDSLSSMNRSISVISFTTQTGSTPAFITVNISLKFYSLKAY